MTAKRIYNIGDDVWIYGITSSNKITRGKVVAQIDLSQQGYGTDLHYVIDVPSHIEPILELRTWHTMSQDEHGPVGSLRDLTTTLETDIKKMKQIGFYYSSTEDNDPTPEEIMAALEKSTDGLTHKPLHIKENKPKRKYFPRKKKT